MTYHERNYVLRTVLIMNDTVFATWFKFSVRCVQDRMNVQWKAKSVLCRSGTWPEVVDKPTSNGKESKIAESKPVGSLVSIAGIA